MDMLSFLPIPKTRAGWILGLLLSTVLFVAYYYYPNSLFAKLQQNYRFHFWDSSYQGKYKDLEFNVIVPKYIAPFVQREMVITAHNNGADLDRAAAHVPEYEFDLIVVAYHEGEPLVLPLQPDLASSEFDLAANNIISFGKVPDKGTVVQQVWVRSPFQTHEISATSPITLAFYVLESRPLVIPSLIENSSNDERNSEECTENPCMIVDNDRAIQQSFIQTILLPPWSNGFLITLALLAAWLGETALQFATSLKLNWQKRDKVIGALVLGAFRLTGLIFWAYLCASITKWLFLDAMNWVARDFQNDSAFIAGLKWIISLQNTLIILLVSGGIWLFLLYLQYWGPLKKSDDSVGSSEPVRYLVALFGLPVEDLNGSAGPDDPKDRDDPAGPDDPEELDGPAEQDDPEEPDGLVEPDNPEKPGKPTASEVSIEYSKGPFDEKPASPKKSALEECQAIITRFYKRYQLEENSHDIDTIEFWQALKSCRKKLRGKLFEKLTPQYIDQLMEICKSLMTDNAKFAQWFVYEELPYLPDDRNTEFLETLEWVANSWKGPALRNIERNEFKEILEFFSGGYDLVGMGMQGLDGRIGESKYARPLKTRLREIVKKKGAERVQEHIAKRLEVIAIDSTAEVSGDVDNNYDKSIEDDQPESG